MNTPVKTAEKIPIERIDIEKDELSLNITEKVKLGATVYPENASEPAVYWYSEDDNIATVDMNGNITAVKAGTVNIIAADSNDNIAVVCKVDVKETSFAVRTPSVTSISYGDVIILHADVENLPAGATIKWAASNGNFDMSVSSDGTTCKITPSSSGDTTFTATVIDANGNVLYTDTQEMTSKAGLWQKIVAFFKKFFGLTKTIPQAFKSIYNP